MQSASFQLSDYLFTEIELVHSFIKNNDLNISFDVSGEFSFVDNKANYKLNFDFSANSRDEENNFIKVACVANFSFENVKSLEDIPEYFYQNSIAILFPYVRAYVSLITTQANVQPIILPTLNLSQLSIPLKENTKIKSS